MGVHIGATWRIQLNCLCAVAIRPFCQITLNTCSFRILRHTIQQPTKKTLPLVVHIVQRCEHPSSAPHTPPHHNRFTANWLTRDHPGEPVPEENFWTLWCKGRLTEADALTIWLGATPSRLTSAHLHHPPCFLQAGCPSSHPTNSVKALKATIYCRRKHIPSTKLMSEYEMQYCYTEM